MTAENLLGQLELVRNVGHDRWTARCPAHADRTPSLAIRVTADGTVLLKCFAGCNVADITRAIGIQLSDLFPARYAGDSAKHIQRPFLRDQVFDMIRTEIGIIWVIARDLHAKRDVSERDYDRLCEAVAKIERIAEASYGI